MKQIAWICGKGSIPWNIQVKSFLNVVLYCLRQKEFLMEVMSQFVKLIMDQIFEITTTNLVGLFVFFF